MTRTVFILGAGASAQAGAPMMNEFLDAADNLWKLHRVGDREEDFKQVFGAIASLQAVHSKAQLDLVNIEKIFSAFQMAKIIGRLPFTRSGDTIDALIESLKRLIVITLEESLEFQYSGDVIVPPEPYLPFVQLIKKLRMFAEPRHQVAVLTFNYDLAIDFALRCLPLPHDYCLDGTGAPDAVPLLKLHGSLNWAMCPDHGIRPWTVSDFIAKKYWPPDLYVGDKLRLCIGRQIGQHKCCDSVESTPVIVPPTTSKAEGQTQIAPVWERAAAELGEADNIFVAGYSLPPSDEFFRYLYALGSVGKTPLKRFEVFDPDPTGEVADRFHKLLGPGASARFTSHQRTFAQGIAMLEKQYGLN